MRRANVPDANCARKSRPSLGVKRLTLRDLLAGNGCGIDHGEPHRLHFQVAILVTGGKWDHMVDFSATPVESDDLLLIRAGQVHAFAKEGRIDGEVLTFTPEFAATLGNMFSIGDTIHTLFEAGPKVHLSQNSAREAHAWMDEFGGELAMRGQPYSEPRLVYSFGLLMNRLAALKEFRVSDDAVELEMPHFVRDFGALVETNFRQRREPAWYAGKLHMSTRTLDRRLARSVKNTCKEMLMSRLILEAKRLLTDPELQVKGIAQSLQFDEAANFSRFFHHHTGMTPSDFRSQLPDWRV